MKKELIPLENINSQLLQAKPQMMLFNKNHRVEKLGGVKHGH